MALYHSSNIFSSVSRRLNRSYPEPRQTPAGGGLEDQQSLIYFNLSILEPWAAVCIVLLQSISKLPKTRKVKVKTYLCPFENKRCLDIAGGLLYQIRLANLGVFLFCIFLFCGFRFGGNMDCGFAKIS